jgi:hypothetical protein
VFYISSDGRLNKRLNELEARMLDRSGHAKFMQNLADAMVDQNWYDRVIVGIDKEGVPLIPWRVRVGPYKNKTGKTLAPFNEWSRSVDLFTTEVDVLGAGRDVTLQLSAGWEDRGPHVRGPDNVPGVKVLRYHANGIKTKSGQVIKRDILGASPNMKQMVQEMWGAFIDRFKRMGR